MYEVEAPMGVGYHDRTPEAFYTRTKNAILEADASKKPFFIYANPIDPHRPWPGTSQERSNLRSWNPDRPYAAPGRRYTPEEVDVPELLPDLPGIRERLVPYYESLHRGDECIGGILKALEESGKADHTLVIFLSDHGMGVVGAKTMLYHHGLRTPVIIKWPGKVAPGKVDRTSILSSIDIFPTVIEAVGGAPIEEIEGKSFLPVATGEAEKGVREYAYAANNYYADSTDEWHFPQRAIIDGDFCYIWNAYVIQPGGDRPYLKGYFADVVAGYLNQEHPELVKKVHDITYKVPEELFDIRKDPGCWKNLAKDPQYAEVLKRYRTKLHHEMVTTQDPQLNFWPE
jgi:N-sulfoglucosamine sulfohydrolase